MRYVRYEKNSITKESMFTDPSQDAVKCSEPQKIIKK